MIVYSIIRVAYKSFSVMDSIIANHQLTRTACNCCSSSFRCFNVLHRLIPSFWSRSILACRTRLSLAPNFDGSWKYWAYSHLSTIKIDDAKYKCIRCWCWNHFAIFASLHLKGAVRRVDISLIVSLSLSLSRREDTSNLKFMLTNKVPNNL